MFIILCKLTMLFLYLILLAGVNISHTKKFEIKSKYYKEEKPKETGISLMDPLTHSLNTLNQNNINVDVSKYILQVIAFSPHGTYCMVNKRILSIGDILDEHNNLKILEIREDSIEIGNRNFSHVINIYT